jgi:hypothetical protein
MEIDNIDLGSLRWRSKIKKPGKSESRNDKSSLQHKLGATPH